MATKSESRTESRRSQYYYRRSLSGRELLPAVGVAIAAGVAAFYFARIYFQRTPLLPSNAVVPRGLRSPAPRDG